MRKYIVVPLIGIACIVLLTLVIRHVNIESGVNMDEARQEYKDSVEASTFYEPVEGDYVESIDISVEDDDYLDSSWEYRTTVKVNVQMEEDFRKLYLKDRSEICIGIDNEIEDRVTELYKNSSFYQLFQENKTSHKYASFEYMMYKGHKLYISHNVDIIFYDGLNEYEFWPTCMSVGKPGATPVSYKFTIEDGHITEFEKIVFNTGNSSSSTDSSTDSDKNGSSSESSDNKKSSTSKDGSKFDPYDVNDYDSAEDFADDKYEEFYDYEDIYEDEDEAYDAAEEYWYEEHE